MSLMAMSAPRSSVFTFESSVHSSHVLCCLDDQRRRDMLCDVTVVVEGQSFRAHRSVLASCSEYFTHRISPLTQHGAVITLPQEVTVAGFEPLLKFAYTSKLLFGKDDVLEIRNSASFLGFRDLDEACFDFLLPKFFSSSNGAVPFPRNTCCKKKCKRQLSKEDCGIDSDDMPLDEKEVKPVADSPSRQEVASLCKKSVNSKMGSQNSTGTLTPAAEGANDNFMQCPKYRKFQLACGKETCATEKSQNNVVTVIRDDCHLPSSPCSKNETGQTHPTRQSRGGADELWKTDIQDKKTEDGVSRGEAHMIKKDTNEREGKWDEKERKSDVMKMEEEMEHTDGVSSSCVKAISIGQSAVPGERSPRLILHHCPLRALAEGPAITRSLGQERFVMDIKEDKKPRDSCVIETVSVHHKAEEQVEAEGRRADNAWEERGGSMERANLPVNNAREGGTMEREVAEHLAKPDMASSRLNFQDPDAGSSSDTGSGLMQAASLEWLKLQVNLSSSSAASCPFFQDLDQSKCLWKGAGLSECEGASHSGVSSLNSGEDGDSETETEGDSESSTRERARQVQLPFSVDWIVDLSRNDFQQLLKQQEFTREQLEFVHDMRRRSKNRLAAQRCRKRKLDCIYNLQCEINKLKTEREKLIVEKSQLSQLKLKTCHSVTALCQRVCNEANLQPEQLQVLAKYTSPDCPLASFFPHIDAVLSQRGLPVRPPTSLSACSDKYTTSQEVSSSSSRNTVTGDGQPSL
ncbi:transcription regulator protein BACH1-like [Seriola lalandi dorsalis]|uniref:Transcription regulator protein BACH1-like n=1 Tax=Seriola lalandi dorsalis TaxID=1841481 RepID=A0A3B4YZ76_SERLL|nr:transcription regulator protein BACH1-like [Seriola lalandi dorsalis]XP_023258351.1 transcription regulator protein BACH1-like [Seriola lalandi dorsalis]XP_056253651.1 transcription regulator protein BACH1-like [Seriola aureovittata]